MECIHFRNENCSRSLIPLTKDSLPAIWNVTLGLSVISIRADLKWFALSRSPRTSAYTVSACPVDLILAPKVKFWLLSRRTRRQLDCSNQRCRSDGSHPISNHFASPRKLLESSESRSSHRWHCTQRSCSLWSMEKPHQNYGWSYHFDAPGT